LPGGSDIPGPWDAGEELPEEIAVTGIRERKFGSRRSAIVRKEIGFLSIPPTSGYVIYLLKPWSGDCVLRLPTDLVVRDGQLWMSILLASAVLSIRTHARSSSPWI
jgi:hypothetical protein